MKKLTKKNHNAQKIVSSTLKFRDDNHDTEGFTQVIKKRYK